MLKSLFGRKKPSKGFNVPMNTAVFSTSDVLKENMPILYVTHDFDEEMGEDWQFHTGVGVVDMDKAMLVSLQNILDYDSTISQLSDLPIGYCARRTSLGGAWTYAKQ